MSSADTLYLLVRRVKADQSAKLEPIKWPMNSVLTLDADGEIQAIDAAALIGAAAKAQAAAISYAGSSIRVEAMARAAADAAHSEAISGHTARTDNPHGTTAAQLGIPAAIAAALVPHRRRHMLATNVSLDVIGNATIFTGMPAKYLVTGLWVLDFTDALRPAQAGLYAGPEADGSAIVPPADIVGDDEYAAFQFPLPASPYCTSPELYFRVTTPKPEEIVSVLLEYIDLSGVPDVPTKA